MIYFYFAEIEFLKHKYAMILIQLTRNHGMVFQVFIRKKVNVFMITLNHKKQLLGVDEYQ
jgi:hypothetical protein